MGVPEQVHETVPTLDKLLHFCGSDARSRSAVMWLVRQDDALYVVIGEPDLDSGFAVPAGAVIREIVELWRAELD